MWTILGKTEQNEVTKTEEHLIDSQLQQQQQQLNIKHMTK